MRIERWPLDKIMQLPDYVFGRRWMVACECRASDGADVWDISEVAFPDIGVIWEVFFFPSYVTYAIDYIRLALGDVLPTATAEMDAMDPLIRGWGMHGADPRRILCYYQAGFVRIPLRTPVNFQGKRLVMEAHATVGKYTWMWAGVIVSGLPMEIPDWLGWVNESDVGGVRGRVGSISGVKGR